MESSPKYQAVREVFSVVPLSRCRVVSEILPISQPVRLIPAILPICKVEVVFGVAWGILSVSFRCNFAGLTPGTPPSSWPDSPSPFNNPFAQIFPDGKVYQYMRVPMPPNPMIPELPDP